MPARVGRRKVYGWHVFVHFGNAWPKVGMVDPNEAAAKALAFASVELSFLEHVVFGVGVE